MSKDNLLLFDEIAREYLGPSQFSESHWHFLNRTGRPAFQYIREVLEDWFSEYKASLSKRRKLCTDFRSGRDAEHLAAFFELYLYHLFKKQGFEIEVEPEWEQGSPDFLLTSANGKTILLEATGIYPERWFGSASKLEQKVLDDLNKHLDSPDFFLDIEIKQAPNNSPPYAQIRRYLQKQLELLDYDQVMQEALGREDMGLERFPSIPWIHDTWTIEFTVMPKQSEARGKAGVRPVGQIFYDFGWVDSVSAIKACIHKKYRHYGELDIPYILAINNVDPFTDEEDLCNALFGQEVWHMNIKTDEISPSRQPNGAWFGPRGWTQTRISSICSFQRLRPENIHMVSPIIWHHPFAQNPLEPNLINLTQQIPNLSERSFDLREGVHPATLLQLDKTQMPT